MKYPVKNMHETVKEGQTPIWVCIVGSPILDKEKDVLPENSVQAKRPLSPCELSDSVFSYWFRVQTSVITIGEIYISCCFHAFTD